MRVTRAVISCTLLAATLWVHGARAQAPAQTGEMSVRLQPSGAVPAKVPAMVSLLRNGEVFRQTEVLLDNGSGIWCCIRGIPVGVYDLRVEAEGLVTEAKRGVRVLAGPGADLTFLVKSGKGMHTVEYAIGGLSREEVASRLASLDAAVAKLTAAAARP